MAQEQRTRPYRLTRKVKHYVNRTDGKRVARKLLQIGDVAQLTDSQYAAFSDRFEPVAASDYEPPQLQESDQDDNTSSVDDTVGTSEDDDSTDEVPDTDYSFLPDLHYREAQAYVSSLDSVDELLAVRAVEEENTPKPRASVLSAIDDRIDELS